MICSGSHAVSGIRPGASVINTLVSIDACRYSQGDEVESPAKRSRSAANPAA